jgi:Fic family protein
MSFLPDQPYNDLPPLPPQADIESKATLKACIEARAALSALKQATLLIPNPTVLINTIPLLEAQASTEIENIVTTMDAMFRYAQLDERGADAATKEALRYRTALREGFESIKRRPLSTATAIEICSTVKDVQMQVRRVPGTALANDRTGELIYTPPVGEALIRDKLANWERFIHDSATVDPVIRMAVAHYQFEAIHPFTDGNGRTGRVLNLLVLVQAGLLDLPVLYLSGYIIRHKSDYYRSLLAVTRDGAWEPWLLYMINAVFETAQWTLGRINAIRDLMDNSTTLIRGQLPKVYSHELVDVLFQQPYCRIENLIDARIAKRETASSYLQALVRTGFLSEIKIGREKLFLNKAYLKVLRSEAKQ